VWRITRGPTCSTRSPRTAATTRNPTHYGTDLDEQNQRVQQGEPYDPSTDPGLKATIASFRLRSPFYATSFFQALAARTVKPVRLLSIQGWTDPLFPAVQTLQMFRKLKAADPRYPIQMVFGDIGHSNAQNPAPPTRPIRAPSTTRSPFPTRRISSGCRRCASATR
jgi:hypothetical protein